MREGRRAVARQLRRLLSTSYYRRARNSGFTEFLDDTLAAAFYRLAHDKLKPGGRLVTSGMRPHKLSDYLLRNVADLQTSYRSAETLRGLARQAGFEQISTYEDRTGLQTMLIGVKQS